MKSYKLIALMLVLSLCFGCLFSCENGDKTDETGNPQEQPSADDTNAKEDENLQTDTYKISVKVAFASDDEAMKAAIRNLNASATSTVIEVDKNNLSITSSAEVNGYTVLKNYTLIDSTLYHHSVIRSATQVASVREWSTLTDSNIDNLLLKKGEGAGIDISDFAIINSSKTKDGRFYECSDIFESAAKSLEEILAASFASAEAVVKLDFATYKIETAKGRNVSSTLSCNFIITMNDVDYTLTMRMYYTYDYDAQINISAPDDADLYTEVSYLEIVK